MENLGLVSIITPSYNSAPFIAETIESIINQSYPYWELLITDDCSSDNTIEIIQEFIKKDSRIKLFQLNQNSGAGICRNKSIENAQGRFIAFCDSDDCWMPKKLEKQLAFMIEKNCVLSYTSYMTYDENSKIQGIVICNKKITYTDMKHDDGIGCLTAIYDSQKTGKIYLPHLRKRQDWGLWLKILREHKVSYGMKEPLAIYRLRKSSISRNKLSLIKYNIRVYHEILHFSYIKAYLYFFIIFLPSFFYKKAKIRIINS